MVGLTQVPAHTLRHLFVTKCNYATHVAPKGSFRVFRKNYWTVTGPRFSLLSHDNGRAVRQMTALVLALDVRIPADSCTRMPICLPRGGGSPHTLHIHVRRDACRRPL